MDELTSIIEQATAAIEPGYFHLNIDGGDPIYRERVYCYELYHQMRLRWPEHSPFGLNGEIDKAGHPILTQLGASFAKPDFLVHTPGHMGGNHAVIEVKPRGPSTSAIKTDLDKLSLFTSTVGYERAIYLTYGYDLEATLERIQVVVAGAPADFGQIELWAHREPGVPAFKVT